MSRYLSNPRIDHLIQVLYIISFVKYNECMDLTYDSTKLNITEPTILPHECATHRAKCMRTMYPDAIEDIPTNTS